MNSQKTKPEQRKEKLNQIKSKEHGKEELER